MLFLYVCCFSGYAVSGYVVSSGRMCLLISRCFLWVRSLSGRVVSGYVVSWVRSYFGRYDSAHNLSLDK